MKKLLFIAAVACTASLSQAATVKWNSSAKIADASGTAITSQTGYNALLNGGSIILAILNDGLYNGNYTELGSTATIKTTPPPQAGSLKGNYGFDYAKNTLKDGDILGILFKDASGKYWQLKYTAGGMVDDILTIRGLKDDSFSTNFNYAASGTFTVVPEPTSGLMILLGLAGLALRRKQA